MDYVSGSCTVDKMSGMVYVREDVTPLTLEWKAIEGSKIISFPLNTLVNLQATKDDSPKMILRVIYKVNDEEKAVKLAFTNRPTMNNIKDSLQAIVARQRTIVKDTPTPGPQENKQETPVAPVNSLTNLNNPEALTDASLLKNLQLQQKLLLDDRQLRFVFTQSVMNYKLSPTIFWATRLNQLRTFALTISQHKGPYNILSAIKPVATSDNQVNVNVTRDQINEIFQTYPVVKKAFDDLVPAKFSEGELWSRFFNSKLFRRLRGDKINGSNNRGDVVLDKYLYMDVIEEKRKRKNDDVNKFIDLRGNAEDNSQKLGNKPDVTMRYEEVSENKQENEMMILMKNMNKLSSKMVSMSERSSDVNAVTTDEPIEYPLDLNDLNELEELNYIKLNIDKDAVHMETYVELDALVMDQPAVASYLVSNKFDNYGIDLKDTYLEKNDQINKTTIEMTQVIKQNFKAFKQGSNREVSENLVPAPLIQEIITYNMTIVEFLSHFWKLFQSGQNLGQLKKIFTSLRNYQKEIATFKEKAIEGFSKMEVVKSNDRLKDKMTREFQNCMQPIEIGLERACDEYVEAVKKQKERESELNENGKRPHEV